MVHIVESTALICSSLLIMQTFWPLKAYITCIHSKTWTNDASQKIHAVFWVTDNPLFNGRDSFQLFVGGVWHMSTESQKWSGTRFLLTFPWELRHWPWQVVTSYTGRNSCFDVNIICVPDHFCHPVECRLVLAGAATWNPCCCNRDLLGGNRWQH